ncbi:unnamed protein product [Brassica rapa subsp. narinosa]
MPTLERLSLGTAIITEAVIMAENPSSKISRDRLQRYMNYRLPKMAWVNVLGKSLGKPCETSSSSDPLCLHWDSTRTPTITKVLELEKINNIFVLFILHVEVSTVIGLAEEYKHLVGATHSDDAEFHSVVKLVQQGYKMRRSDWEKGFVDMFVATEDIGQQRNTKDEDAEHGEDLNHNEDEEEKKDEEEKTDEKENKEEEYQKDKEQRKDKNHFMSNNEKLDKLIQMVRDLDKRVVMIQNVLGVKLNDGSPNKEDCENGASSANSGDKKMHQMMKMKKIQLLKKQTLGMEEVHWMMKMKKRYVMKKRNMVTSPTPTFNTHNFDARVSSPIPTFTSPKFDLLFQESHSEKGANEVLMKDVCEILVFQPLMKIKKRLVQQDSQVCFPNFINKNGVRPPHEVDHQDENDTEVEHGAKRVKNLKTNEDGEVNEDASEKSVKGTKKRGRGTKVNISLCIMVYKITNHHHHHIDLLNKLETRYLNENVNLLPCFLYHVY